MTSLWCLLLAAVTTLAGENQPRVVVADRAEEVTAALAEARTDILWARVTAAALGKAEQTALRSWVDRGGTLWLDTDLAGLFGFETVPVPPRERLVHGRRACPQGASPLLAQVEDVYARLGDGSVFLVAHANALPLLSVADPLAPSPRRRMLAALLPYGSGEVICRPVGVTSTRGDGARFEANLAARCNRTVDEAAVPIETLGVAQQRLTTAREKLEKEPAEAKRLLNQVFLAYRLWYGDYLTGKGQLEEAANILGGIATELPDDPALYLAVARLNDRLGRAAEAAEARRRAAAAYDQLKRDPPGPDARQLRVDWPVFAESINAVARVWQAPTAAGLDELLARTNHLLALDACRRWDLTRAEALWTAATRLLPNWAPPIYHLGLLYHSRADNLRQPARDRAALYTRAAAQFTAAGQRGATAEFPAVAAEGARAWARAATSAAARAAADPPAALVRGGIILRYNDQDRRLQVGPLRESLAQAFAEAYQVTTEWGVWADDVEVLAFDDDAALRAALPPDLVGRQVFGSGATAGRRVLIDCDPPELIRLARHQTAHAVINAYTAGGLPAPLWFEEGLAWRCQQHGTLAQQARVSLRRGVVLSVAQINSPEVMYSRRTADQAYGQAQVMVDVLLRRFGPAVIANLLQACGWGIAPETAVRQLTGLGQAEFLAALLEGRLGSY